MNEVLIVRHAADSGMVILIWMVQLIIYPSFRHIGAERFVAWHKRYVNTIGCMVIPLMLVQLAVIGLQLIDSADPFVLLSLLAVLCAWLVTFTVSAPCHRKLQTIGKDEVTISRVISTNWLRTIAWSIAWLSGMADAIG